MKRCTNLLKFVPALLLIGLPLYTLTFLEERRPRGVFEKITSGFTIGLEWILGVWIVGGALIGGAWGLVQLIRRAEREGWLGRLLAVPITFAVLACLFYSASEWWVAGPGRLPIWGFFFLGGLAVGFLVKRTTAS